MTLVLVVVACVLVAVIYGYERDVERLKAKFKVMSEELAVVRGALRRSQELLEDDHEEVDQLRAERVVPESCGAGGQC